MEAEKLMWPTAEAKQSQQQGRNRSKNSRYQVKNRQSQTKNKVDKAQEQSDGRQFIKRTWLLLRVRQIGVWIKRVFSSKNETRRKSIAQRCKSWKTKLKTKRNRRRRSLCRQLSLIVPLNLKKLSCGTKLRSIASAETIPNLNNQQKHIKHEEYKTTKIPSAPQNLLNSAIKSGRGWSKIAKDGN